MSPATAIYEGEAGNSAEAAENRCEGDLVYHDESLNTDVLSVKEAL